MQKGRLISTAKDQEAESVYEMYYEFDEALSKVAGHRTLAINRGEKEKILTVKIEAPTEDIIKYLKKQVITNDKAPTAAVLTDVVEDAYDRLIAPAIAVSYTHLDVYKRQGRGLDYALSMEGALKLKEISYIHAEAYAAGELKHGTIALISEGVPVIAVATQSHVYSKVISNIREVKARGAYVILLSKDKDITDKSICDVHISLPQAPDEFVIFESVIICQLIAYYTSTGKGLNPDQPRNLAKSVTVE